MPLDSTTETVWEDDTLSANQMSTAISLATASRVRLLGTVDTATSFDIFFGTSAGGTYYKSELSISVGGADDFSLAYQVEAPYMKVRCNSAATVTLKVVKKITTVL